ncbi:MAG: rhodanese-like domain-containing protein [Methylacidiphilales bacterium]|nr:rhodanese-like domain-containing protein [Candidatus Methylacidiphilales bacterium]
MAILLTFEYFRIKQSVPLLSPYEVVRMMNQDQAILIDIRSTLDFEKKHITNAIHVNAADLQKQEPLLLKYKQQPLITYCQFGVSSKASAEQLKQLGFSQVYSMRGGLQSWESDHLPVQHGK